ncbi:MAG: hypothetical protein LQ352_001842 [Teloschistes flavicans]|nr:MAG: hypothetical protein LQ352_001842 [Teloschistes flavicans]
MSSLQLAGPRPTNTLSRSTAAPRQPFNVPTVSTTRGTRRELETATSIGNNVPLSTLEFNGDRFLADEPKPKRQKLGKGHNSQNTPQILDGSDDEDHLMVDDVIGIRHVPSRSHKDVTAGSTTSLPSGNLRKQIQRKPIPNIGVQEFKTVEAMMDSTVPKRKKPTHSQSQDSSRTPRSSFGSSKSETMELLDIDDMHNPVVKKKYMGTANLHPPRHSHAISNGVVGRLTGNRSRYFPSSDNPRASQVKDAAKEVIRTEARLTDQFRDTNGERRGGTESISSDEITAAGPNSRALSPVKPARAHSPVKLSQPIASIAVDDDESQDLKPFQSNIRPSAFTNTANSGARKESHTRRNNGLQENPAPWNLRLKAYNFQGKRHADDSLALVFNKNFDSYDIHHNGSNLAKEYPALRANPAKVFKIRWAINGTKIRLSSSKVGNYDNELDIEMYTERDVVKLNTKLQELRSIDVKGESGYAILLDCKLGMIDLTKASNRERMENMFEHRLKEQRKAMASGRVSAIVPPDDIDLARRRIERADQKRFSAEQKEINFKRTRLVDKIKAEPERSNTLDQSSTSAVTARTQNTAKARSSENSSNDETKLLDDYLKRSLRSQTKRGASSKNTHEAFPDALKPDVEKYSISHGLGRQWSKPLIYPKEGKKRTTVEWTDLERLDEGEFLNDSLIAFYLRYLEIKAEQADPTTLKRVYMFNTFFFNSLTTTESGSRGFNYDAVQRWTRNVDLFTYDFVVVPVNESSHWYVAVICNLPAIHRTLDDQEDELSPNFALPGENGQEQHATNSDMFSSSPQRAIGETDPQEATPQVNEDPTDAKEQETAASFAEMSLEANEDPSKGQNPSPELPGAFQSNEIDQEMLDDQLQSSVVGNDAQQVLNTEKPQKAVDEDTENNQDGKASPSQLKKGKRKSQPPPRLFDPYKPTILTFDSLGTPHFTAIRFLKQYLQEEAKSKRGNMVFDAKALRGVTAKRIPEQDNYCDCGLFLLGYMEKFFENPRNFIDNVMRQAWDIKTDWPKLDPSKMRGRIRTLLMDLNKEREQERKKARLAQCASSPLKAPSTSPHQPKSKDKALNITTKDTGSKEDFKDQPAEVLAEAPLQVPPAHAPEPEKNAEDRAGEAHKTMTYEISPCFYHKSSRVVLGDITPAIEAHASPSPTLQENTKQSFIVPDSQPQPIESESTPNPSHSHPEPDTLALPPELPSTIQDSQPPMVPESVEEDGLLEKQARAEDSVDKVTDKTEDVAARKPMTPPLADGKSTKPRRIDSFSSPPPEQAAKAQQPDPHTPENRATKRVITGTDPKVVIALDD